MGPSAADAATTSKEKSFPPWATPITKNVSAVAAAGKFYTSNLTILITFPSSQANQKFLVYSFYGRKVIVPSLEGKA